MTKYISFDLDGTLASLDFDEAIWLEEIPKLYAEKNKLDLKTAKDQVYADYFRAWFIDKVPDWTDIGYWFKRFGLNDWEQLIEDMKKHIYLFEHQIHIVTGTRELNYPK